MVQLGRLQLHVRQTCDAQADAQVQRPEAVVARQGVRPRKRRLEGPTGELCGGMRLAEIVPDRWQVVGLELVERMQQDVRVRVQDALALMLGPEAAARRKTVLGQFRRDFG